jgi:glycosyltransferase involved in cell wall biosynthesis
MPSDGDGFGIVFLEAMMHGLCCVGLANSAAAEIFEDRVSGVLVNRDDRADLALCLTGLLLNPTRRREIGEGGRVRWNAAFTGAHYAGRLRGVLTRQLALPVTA